MKGLTLYLITAVSSATVIAVFWGLAVMLR